MLALCRLCVDTEFSNEQWARGAQNLWSKQPLAPPVGDVYWFGIYLGEMLTDSFLIPSSHLSLIRPPAQFSKACILVSIILKLALCSGLSFQANCVKYLTLAAEPKFIKKI